MLKTGVLSLPLVLLFGSGTAQQVGSECNKLGVRKGLVVTDETIIQLGLLDDVKSSLAEANVATVIYSGVFTEPTVEFVEDGFQKYQENGCDFLLAFGGGSAIDTAKAIAVMATNEGSIEQYQGIDKIPKAGVPLVAIPTTAGTGSEVTKFTIIGDTKKDVKMLIGSPYLVPKVAIVDPMLTLTMPRGLTAATGIDALTHAVEAYVSIKASPLTDLYCLSSIKLISSNLRQAWSNGNNVVARENMMLGALQAGIAFSNSSVALVHAMSRPIGAYFHVAHGVSNAALLGVLTEFSLMGDPDRYADIARAMGENIEGLTLMEAATLATESIQSLVKDIKIPSLKELGVDKQKLLKLATQMAEDALSSGSAANNPRQATQEEIAELYDLVYGH